MFHASGHLHVKNAGDTWMSVIFSRQWLHFRWGLRLHLQRVAAVSVFSNNAAAGGKAGQGLRSTFSKSGVQRSERHRCLDSWFHSGFFENEICWAQLNPFLFNEYSGYLKHMPVNLKNIFDSLWLLVIFPCISEYDSKLVCEGSAEQLCGSITI